MPPLWQYFSRLQNRSDFGHASGYRAGMRSVMRQMGATSGRECNEARPRTKPVHRVGSASTNGAQQPLLHRLGPLGPYAAEPTCRRRIRVHA